MGSNRIKVNTETKTLIAKKNRRLALQPAVFLLIKFTIFYTGKTYENSS